MTLKILIYCDRKQALGETGLLVEGLSRDGRFEPVVFLGSFLDSEAEIAFQRTIIHLAYLEHPSPGRRLLKAGIHSTIALIDRFFGFRRRGYYATRMHLKIREMMASRILDQIRPDAVVIPDDRINRYNLGLILAGRKRRLPIVVVPWAVSDADIEANSRLRQGLLARPEDRHVMPSNVRRVPGSDRDVLFYVPGQAQAFLDAGLRFVTPWLVGGGDIDRMCLPSEADRQRLLAEGVPPGRLVVTGRPSSDRLHESRQGAADLRRRLAQDYGLDGNRPLTLVAVPPYWEVGFLPRDRADAHIEGLLSALAAHDRQVLVSLHPRMQRSRYAWIEERHGFRILKTALRDALPAAELLVSYESSVNLWAGRLGIPVVMVQGTPAPAGSFAALPGLIECTVTDLSALPQWQVACPTEPAAMEHAYGPFDGQCVRRIGDVLASMTKYRHALAA